MLKREVPVDWLISADRNAPAMQDDRPVNEYYWIRATGARLRWKWLETAPEMVTLWLSQILDGQNPS
jgi:hypothetical protein